LKYKVLN